MELTNTDGETYYLDEGFGEFAIQHASETGSRSIITLDHDVAEILASRIMARLQRASIHAPGQNIIQFSVRRSA